MSTKNRQLFAIMLLQHGRLYSHFASRGVTVKTEKIFAMLDAVYSLNTNYDNFYIELNQYCVDELRKLNVEELQ